MNSLKQACILEISLNAIYNFEGKIQGARLYFRDLTPIKKMEEDLKISDRLAIMGTIAMGLAHEIKNPLGGIKGAAQMLKRQLKEEEHQDYLRMIIQETERVNELILELLDFANPKKMELQKINLNQLLEEVLLLEEPIVQENGIQYRRFYDPSLPEILGDSHSLKQVFLNLLKNAREALGSQGKIKIRTRLFTH